MAMGMGLAAATLVVVYPGDLGFPMVFMEGRWPSV
jgi:hypothetical protein